MYENQSEVLRRALTVPAEEKKFHSAFNRKIGVHTANKMHSNSHICEK